MPGPPAPGPPAPGPTGRTETRRSPAGIPRFTEPETGAGPQATVSLIAVLSPGCGADRPGDRCTATGRLPAGAGPLPCSQYLVKTGWAGSGAGSAACACWVAACC